VNNGDEAGKIRTAVAKTGLTNADRARNVLIGAASANYNEAKSPRRSNSS